MRNHLGVMRGRWLPLVLLAALAGCAASGAARGCAGACRGGSGLARSTRGLEEVVRVAPRFGARSLAAERLAEAGLRGAGARGVSALDHAVAALPEARGPVSALAKVPASNGAVMVGRRGARSFADDYARSIDAIGVTRQQHVDLLDVLDVAQSMLDVVTAGDGDGADDEASAGSAAGAIDREVQMTIVAAELDARMKQVLDDAQLQRLYGALGPPKVMAHRLARERPMERPSERPGEGSAARIDLR